MTQWRSIPGYEGRYEVSDDGQVQSIRREGAPGGARRLRIDRLGYARIALFGVGGKHGKDFGVHQLVLRAFVGPQDAKMQCRHLNGNRRDNRLVNLTYGTVSENILDQVIHGTHAGASKTHCKRGHELTEANIYPPPADHPTWRRCRLCGKSRAVEERRARELKAQIERG